MSKSGVGLLDLDMSMLHWRLKCDVLLRGLTDRSDLGALFLY